MSKFLLTLFGFLAIFAIVSEAAVVCGPNEEYTECGSPHPLTCKNPIPCNCLEPCVKGCFCKAGLVRDDNNNCISARDCPKSQE